VFTIGFLGVMINGIRVKEKNEIENFKHPLLEDKLQFMLYYPYISKSYRRIIIKHTWHLYGGLLIFSLLKKIVSLNLGLKKS